MNAGQQAAKSMQLPQARSAATENAG